MINANQFKLTYICKETLEEFPARITGSSHVSILKDGEEIKYTVHEARKLFRPSKDNRKASRKHRHALPTMGNKLYFSSRFRNFLDESDEKLVSDCY